MPRTIAVALATILSGHALVAQPGNAWIVVVDDLHIDFVQTGRLRTFLRAASDGLLQNGDRFLIHATGPSAVSLKADMLTTDRDTTSASIRTMTGHGLKAIDILAPPPARPVDELLYRANAALDAAENVVDILAREAAPRKAIVFISNGYDVESHAALADRARHVARRAGESDINVFAVDARRFDPLPLPDARLDNSAWHRYQTASLQSLKLIVEGTGGFVLENPNASIELSRVSALMRR